MDMFFCYIISFIIVSWRFNGFKLYFKIINFLFYLILKQFEFILGILYIKFSKGGNHSYFLFKLLNYVYKNRCFFFYEFNKLIDVNVAILSFKQFYDLIV